MRSFVLHALRAPGGYYRARYFGLVILCLALGLTACRRERPTLNGADSGDAAQSGSAGSSSIMIDHKSPDSGAVLVSPIRLRGNASIAEGQALIAVVYSVDERDESKWRGNRLLDLDAQGAYDNEVAYKISIDSPGYIEIGVLDAASGTIVQRERIAVELVANP